MVSKDQHAPLPQCSAALAQMAADPTDRHARAGVSALTGSARPKLKATLTATPVPGRQMRPPGLAAEACGSSVR
jgi:hypothetical protein